MSESENMRCARAVLDALYRYGVEDICLCPGRRNAPFVTLLDGTESFKVFPFFEERSAGFFALGRAKASGRPAAIITTSGTAVAELLPSVIEAFYGGQTLILVTADRPKRLRYTGAPQTIIQPGIFGPYAPIAVDLAPDETAKLPDNTAGKTLHLNVCFDEPLAQTTEVPYAPSSKDRDIAARSPLDAAALRKSLAALQAPLVIAGPLRKEAARSVEKFLSKLRAPLLLEASSQLRGSSLLRGFELQGGAESAKALLQSGHCKSVLRIGGVPAARVWRDLDEAFSHVPVLSISEVPFPGLGRGDLLHGDLSGLEKIEMSFAAAGSFSIPEDAARSQKLKGLLQAEPLSEAGLVFNLSRMIPPGSDLYLGNSLPIREWDLAASRDTALHAIEVNRGANGIDGQVSAFFGWISGQARAGAEAWAILGDLTTLYDLSGPWAAQYLPKRPVRLVIVNNFGGQIFSRMFGSTLFLNSHALSFEGWAKMWNFDYIRLSEVPEDLSIPERVVIELRPDMAATGRFWEAFDKSKSVEG